MIFRAFFYEGSLSLIHFQNLFSSEEYVKLKPSGVLFQLAEKRRFNPETGKLEVIGKTLYIGVKGPDFGIILNSFIVAISVTCFSIILGTIVAFIIARYEFPGKNVYRVLTLVPMLATPFVNAYVVAKVFGENGLFNYLFYHFLKLLPYEVALGGLPGIVLIQTLSFYPIVYLNVLSSLINIDPSLEEQAENLGAYGFKLFRTVTLPLMMPGLAAGATIVFIFSMEDLGAPIALKGAFGDDFAGRVMSFTIYDEFRKGIGTIEQVHASTYALAVIMLTIAIIGFLAIKKYVSLRSYAMLSKGGRWSPRVKRVGLLKSVAIYVVLSTIVFSASFPQIGVVVLALTDWASSGGPLPSKFTLENFYSLIFNPEVVRSILNSLTYAGLALLVIVLVGTSAAYVVSRVNLRIVGVLDALSTLPIAIPGIIVAVGYLLFFASFFNNTLLDPFYNPGLLLVLAYSVRRLPFTARSVYAGLQQTHISLEEASYSVGASRTMTFFRIVLPLISANIIGGAILSFVYSMSEVSVSITLSNLAPEQGPITFYMSQAIYASAAVGTVSVAAVLGVLLMTSQIIAITVSNYILKQRVAFLGV